MLLRFKYKKRKKIYIKLKALDKCPQKGGTCFKIFMTCPKKPNSALRNLAKVRLTNTKKLIAHIPGELHNLFKYSSVLCHGHRVRDLPGIKYRIIRHAYGYSCSAVVWRLKSRSKYGAPNIPVKIEAIRMKELQIPVVIQDKPELIKQFLETGTWDGRESPEEALKRIQEKERSDWGRVFKLSIEKSKENDRIKEIKKEKRLAKQIAKKEKKILRIKRTND